MSLNKTDDPLKMDLILDGLLLIRMIVRFAYYDTTQPCHSSPFVSLVSISSSSSTLFILTIPPTNQPTNSTQTDTNEALHFYRPENVRTTNGVLNITTIQKSNKYKAFDEDKLKYYADAKHIQSGMVQGWNKFCMTGGIIEFSAKLPGDPKTGGLWPALWMLGNLARATYVGSSNFIWPFSYDSCDEKNRLSQQISACSKVGHYGMKPGVGRGSPEIDILEAMMGGDEKLPSTNVTRPYFSTSLQIAPGLDSNRPNLGKLPKKVSGWFV